MHGLAVRSKESKQVSTPSLNYPADGLARPAHGYMKRKCIICLSCNRMHATSLYISIYKILYTHTVASTHSALPALTRAIKFSIFSLLSSEYTAISLVIDFLIIKDHGTS